MKDSINKPPFLKVLQIGIVVRDVEKTVERLTSLGIGPFKVKSLPRAREETFRGKPMNAEFNIHAAMIGDIEIELIQPLSGESPHKEFLETKGEGIQHIACAVMDVSQTVDELTQKGASEILRAKFGRIGEVAYLDLGVSNIIIELMKREQLIDRL